MLPIHPIPLLLSIVIVVLIILLIWGFWQIRCRKSIGTLVDLDHDHGNLQLWFLALAIFTVGILVTYVSFIFF